MARPHRALVMASLPSRCVVCGGRRAVSTATGRVPCPHCVQGLPVLHLPMHQDIPRGTPA